MFFVLLNPARTDADSSGKVSTLTRCIAKGIDLCVIFLFSVVLPYPVGVLLGFIYTIIHDGLFGGQSLGKRIFHLRAVQLADEQPCGLRESVIRNSPLGVAALFGIIPFWGWIILVILGIPLMALEIYLMITQPGGSRLGDVMADTKVIEVARSPRSK